jgi:hypothetical protein
LCAGMSGVSGKPVVTTLVRPTTPILPARLRVHWAPGIPHALSGRKINQRLGRNRAARSWTFVCDIVV